MRKQFVVWMIMILAAVGCTAQGTSIDGRRIGGAIATSSVTGKQLGGTFQVDQFAGSTLDAQLTACLGALNTTYGGTCDARNYTGSLTLAGNVTISVGNAHIILPCATLNDAYQFIVSVGVRNTNIEGCSFLGGSTSNGVAGGTVINYTGTTSWLQVGDPAYSADTPGFSFKNAKVVLGSGGSAAIGLGFYRTQEIDVEHVYVTGNNAVGQVGLLLDGHGNYTGGTFTDVYLNGAGTGVQMIGDHTGGANANTFNRVHVVCPGNGSLAGTIGIDIQYGDGNTFNGGDVEQCYTMLHLGSGAVNNATYGLRNEVSNSQYVADSGSNNNNIDSGTPIYNNATSTNISDSGTNNSFRSPNTQLFNPITGAKYHDLVDNTLTDHNYYGIELGNERGHKVEIETDWSAYSGTARWTEGYTDGAGTGAQAWVIHDGINAVDRFNAFQYVTATANTVVGITSYNGGCYSSNVAPTLTFTGGGGSGAAATATLSATTSTSCNSGAGYTVTSYTITNPGSGYTSNPTLTASGSNQITAPRVLTAEVATAGSTNNYTVINSAGTGAVVINGSNNAGTGGTIFGSGGSSAVASAQIDSTGDINLYTPNATGYMSMYNSGVETWQLEYNAASFAIHNNNATTPANVFTVYPNAGTNVNSQGSSPVGINSTSTGGTGGLTVYGGGTNYNVTVFHVAPNGSSGVMYVPWMAATSGHNCLQVDNSGYITNTGSACGTGSGSGSVTSVAMTMPGDFSLSGSPITGSGTFNVTWANENQAYVHIGPASGGAGTPSWRALVATDIPTLNQSTTGNAATATNFATAITGIVNGNGASAPGAATSHNLSLPANCVAASGSGTAYTCSTSPTFVPASGDHIQFKADVANTGSATLAVNSASAATVYKWGNSSTLAAGDLQAGHWITATYDGTHWQLEGQLGNANATQVNGLSLPTSTNHVGTNSSGQFVASPNTMGCLDGYDHLPCTVYDQTLVSESTPSGSYATVYTTTAAGVYRVTGYLYGTTASSTAYQVAEYAQAVNTGSSAHGNIIASGQIGTTISSGNSYPATFNLASGIAIQIESATTSGSNTSGVWSRAVQIERIQ